jgi:hypothetical protein
MLTAFFLGAVSSFVAGLLVLALSHLDDLRYLTTNARRYHYLGGEWFEYHLTTDSKRNPPQFWSHAITSIRVTSFGHIKGTSNGRIANSRGYRVNGAIRQSVMRLRLINRDASELPGSFTYPRLLSSDVLIGVWVGYDYDENVSASTAVLSRKELTSEELASFVRSERLLSVVGQQTPPPIAPINT